MENEVQAAQNNGVEEVKRFVNVHLHCIASNLKRIRNFDVALSWEIFCGRSWMH